MVVRSQDSQIGLNNATFSDIQANGRQHTAAAQGAGHGGGGNRAAAVAGAGGYNSSEFVDY